MNRLAVPLLIVAAICTANAAIAFFAKLSPDSGIYLLVAIVTLGAKFAIDYRQHEHDRRIADEREAVWARRLAR